MVTALMLSNLECIQTDLFYLLNVSEMVTFCD